MKTDKIIEIKALGFPWETQDPFLFCAYHRDLYPKGNGQMGVDAEDLKGRMIGQDFTIKDGWRMYHGRRVPGFPYHPHRGFETITINKEGFVDHSDSLGAAGRFGAGDIQWMTAGKGIQHAEMFPLIHETKGNPLEIFQVWLNLPKKSKFVEPHFKMLWKDMVPTVIEKDINGKATELNVIAGNFKDIHAPEPTPNSWAANPENGVTILTIKMEADTTCLLPATSYDVNRTLYFYRGDTLSIDEESIQESHLIRVDPHVDIELQNGNKDGFILMLQGKAINEPVAQQGPFVMNSQTEIQEAIDDYRKTQFGGWPWTVQEVVHTRNKGRFALHADGSEELKG